MSERINEKFIPLKENGQRRTHIKIEVGYSLGGHNWATGKIEKRGYYVYVTPIARYFHENGCYSESYTGFSGVKQCVKECQRRGKKAAAEAIQNADAIQSQLVEYVCKTNGLEIEETEC